MKQNLSDKGLRKAMQEQSPRLSSNFTFRAMLKVDEMLRIQEAKQEKRMFIAIVAVSLLLLAGGGITIAYYWGDTLREAFASIPSAIPQVDLFSSPYWMLAVIFFILMGFDYRMRRRYYKRHQDTFENFRIHF